MGHRPVGDSSHMYFYAWVDLRRKLLPPSRPYRKEQAPLLELIISPMQIIGLLLFAYLLGSIPTGLVLGFVSGVDVRRGGSGNIGTTNVARLVGWKAGLLTLIADIAKGMIPILLAAYFNFDLSVQVQTALAAFIGHLYPVFLKFRGGKGVATALGIFIALAPWVTPALIVVFALVALTTR